MLKSLRKLLTGITLAAGLLAYAGCAEEDFDWTQYYLDNASEFTEEQLAEVEDAIEDGKYEKQAVNDLILYSNPLFDEYGEPVEDNTGIPAAIDILEERVDYYFENNRIKGYYIEDIGGHDTSAAFFIGIETPNDLSDDYIFLNLTNFEVNAGILYHETSHGPYGLHSEEMNKYFDEHPHDPLYNGFLEVIMQTKDFPYLIGTLYTYVGNNVEDSESYLEEMEDGGIEKIMEEWQEEWPCYGSMFSNQEWWIEINYRGVGVLGITEEEALESLQNIYDESKDRYFELVEEHDPNYEVFCPE